MIWVEGLDVCAHLADPGSDGCGGTVGSTGKVSSSVGAAAGLVGDFPGKNGGGVLVSVHNG
jgi:hypothetical protein